MTKIEQAAHIGHPIEHTNAARAMMAVLAVGVAAGAVVLSGGLALGPILAVAGTTSTAMGVAGVVGGLTTYEAGDITTGASSVHLGTRERLAARVMDDAECHDEPIISGCKHIFIELKQAARATEKTRCDGKIKEDACCPTVHYGGPSIQIMPVRYNGDKPAWLFWTDIGLSVISLRVGRPDHLRLLANSGRLMRIAARIERAVSVTRVGMDVLTGVLGLAGADDAAATVAGVRRQVGARGVMNGGIAGAEWVQRDYQRRQAREALARERMTFRRQTGWQTRSGAGSSAPSLPPNGPRFTPASPPSSLRPVGPIGG